MAKTNNKKSNLITKPTLIELNNSNKKKIQPFLDEFLKVYNGIEFDKIPQIDKDKYFQYLDEVKKQEDISTKEFWQNIGHKETDTILSNSKGNLKTILVGFLSQLETFTTSHKSSNTLFNLFYEQLYYLVLGSNRPKFAQEVFINKIEILPKVELRFYFLDYARAYLELELKQNNNENYKILHQLLKANANKQKLLIDKRNKEYLITKQHTTQPITPQKEFSRKEKIKWTKRTSLLAYLFYKLEAEKLIIGGTIPANISSIFTGNQYNEIDPKTIQKAITDYKDGVKAHGKIQIDELVELIKNISEKLD